VQRLLGATLEALGQLVEVAGEVEYLGSNFVGGIKRLPARIP
jgi:hypothetical protein